MTAPIAPSAPAAETKPTETATPAPAGGDGGGAPAGPSGPSLGDQIGAMLGTEPGVTLDVGLPAKTPGETDGGTPKPETPETPETAAPVDPAAPVADPAAPADPLAGAQPFTYGDGKTLDGIHVIPGEGALIPEANLHVLRTLAEQRDALDQSSQQYADQVQHYEDVTGFVVTGPDGKEQRVTGAQGVAEMRVAIARSFAENEALKAVLSDPNRLLSLIARDGDKFVLNEDALESLSLRIDVAARTGEDAVRKAMAPHIGQRQPARRAEAPSASTPAAQQALAAQAPAVIEQAAKASGLDAKLLTDTDRAFLSAQLPRYTRTVTEQDRRFNPQLRIGAPIVDASFTDVVKDRIGLRQESAKAASATAKAAEENARKAAAAAAGTPARPAAAAPAVPGKPKLSDDHIAFRRMEAASMGRRYDEATDKIV